MAGPAAGGRSPVVLITGPTAVGKTELSIRLAQALDGEIISADSVQVYRTLDVGSDKISVHARRGIPHHLLDVMEPSDEFSAGMFHDLAWTAVQDISQRGKLPIVVGGTGLYLSWFMHGKPGTPASTPATTAAARARLQQAWDAASQTKPCGQLSPEEAWAAGCRLVAELGDPETASRLGREPNNAYRLERVVEILLASPGSRLGDFAQQGDPAHDGTPFHAFFLVRPREALYRRIDARVEQMAAGGMIREAGELLRAGVLPGATCASRAIGYRQAMQCLEGLQAPAARDTAGSDQGLSARLVRLVKDVQGATRKLCHRQMTWFRGRPGWVWLDATRSTDDLLAAIIDGVRAPGAAVQGPGLVEAAVQDYPYCTLTAEEQHRLKRYQPKPSAFLQPQHPDTQRALAEVREHLAMCEAAGPGEP